MTTAPPPPPPPATHMRGAVVVEQPHGTWAWTGVRISAAVDLAHLAEYGELSEQEQLYRAVGQQIDAIAQMHRHPVELRYIWEPHIGALSCFVLTLVARPTSQEAHAASEEAVAQLMTGLPNVEVSALTTDEVSLVLAPFDAHPDGAIEVRKRVLVDTPRRPGAGAQSFVAVEPFTVRAHDWSPFLRTLTHQRQPVVASIALYPMLMPAEFGAALEQTRAAYATLANGSESGGSRYGGVVQHSPEPFAADAQRSYADAAHRYTSGAYRMRISVYSPQPLTDTVPGALGATLARSGDRDQQIHRTEAATGSAFTLQRPATDEDLAAFNASVTSLGFYDWAQPWPFTEHGVPALAPLAWVVDAREAAAAFRLPIALEGQIPGFPIHAPAPAAAPAEPDPGEPEDAGEQVGPDEHTDDTEPVDDVEHDLDDPDSAELEQDTATTDG